MIRSFYVILSCFLIQFSVTTRFLSAQSGWGEDMRLTYNIEGTVYSPRIAVSGDTLHIVWYQRFRVDTLIVTEVMYKHSTDQGETWTQDTILSPIPPGVSNMPDIAVSGSGVHVVWTEEAGDSVVYIRSTDGGRTWMAPITMTQAGGNTYVGAIGYSVFVEWGRVGGTYYKLSYNGGISWSPEIQIPRPSRIGDKKVQMKESFIHLAPYGYPTDTSVIMEVFHQYSSDCGQTWSVPVMLSEQDMWAGQYPSIAVDNDSNVFVNWYDYKNSPYAWTGSIFVRHATNNGAAWDTIQNITTLYRAKRPDISVQNDNLHVVWMDQRDYPGSPFDSFEIYYRHSSDKGNTWGPETRLTYDPHHSTTPRLAVDSGYVYLVWADNRDLDSIYRGYEIYFKRGQYDVGVFATNTAGANHSRFRVFPTVVTNEVKFDFVFLEPFAWQIEVFDILGREVKQYQNYGVSGEVIWDCKDNRGKEVRNGIYFIRLQTERKSYQQKVVLLTGGIP